MGSRKTEDDRRARILEYWRAIEYFSPQKISKVDPERNVFSVHAQRPLPWEAGSELSRRPRSTLRRERETVWQHTVYAGVFELAKMRAVLEEAFRSPESEHDFDGRITGHTALLSFVVTEEGRLIRTSATLSACAWAVSRTLSPGPQATDWLEGWDEDSEELLAVLLDVGDGDAGIEFGPGGSGSGPGSGGPRLGPIAGSTARIALDAAASGVDAAAKAAGTAAGAAVGGFAAPIVGAVVSKAVSGAGDALLDAARSRIGAGKKDDGAGGGGGSADGDTGGGADSGDDEPPKVGTKVLTVDDLSAITRWVAERLGVGEELEPTAIRVHSYRVSVKNAEESAGEGLMNSFYADDLDRAAKSVASGAAGPLLTGYLCAEESVDSRRRVDLRRSPQTQLKQVQPSAMPLGRWPSPVGEPLALSQQFAVNRLMAQLGAPDARGSYAVNGPPGTGKTTMLRDVIAAVVVQRAERLADLKRPEDAFGKTALYWQTADAAGKNHRMNVRPLIAELTGFEMVVASANNGAVANVTMEIPALKAVESWETEASYLAGPAGNLCEEPVWGAVAARLGRRSYRQEFVEDFFWARDRSRQVTSPGLHDLLRQQEEARSAPSAGAAEPPLGTQTWDEAKERFETARKQVAELAAARQRIADVMANLAGPDSILLRLAASAGDARSVLAAQQASLATARAAYEVGEARRRAADDVLAEAARSYSAAEDEVWTAQTGVEAAEAALFAQDRRFRRPGALRRFVSRGAADQRWQEQRAHLVEACDAADAVFAQRQGFSSQAQAAVRMAQSDVSAASASVRDRARRVIALAKTVQRLAADVDTADDQYARRVKQLKAYQLAVERARKRWGSSVPGDEWQAPTGDDSNGDGAALRYESSPPWSTPSPAGSDAEDATSRRELSAPWMDEEFAAARTRLFLAALDLHRALFANAPGLVRKNLISAMAVVKGTAPPDLPEATVLAAWQMLFLVVPVVSTTFASLGRMFSGLGSEALGWLFVDEAGQAPPQQAVGALWRFQRAVVVGDPLQLEPVVTLPWTAQTRLARRFGVGEEWAPSRASVQTLADRLADCGAWLDDAGGDKTWVASPLRVHRRCDQLMFEVSNAIAYDGMMVNGVNGRPEYPFLTRSGWAHIPARPSGGKWNPAEGAYVLRIMERLAVELSQSLLKADLSSDDPPRWSDPAIRRAEVLHRMAESVFVVSPFADVASRLRELLDDWLPTDRDRGRVGTVHVTQGKEADIVILVLGSAADQPRSRAWAAQRPNLLNVAITRAKRRLIVVGDHDCWTVLPYFSELAANPLLGEVRRPGQDGD
ncbi:AAA domain-containing protein [Catenulispora yoronensis]|uniref:AAA domain-containing protein n=1 Tax=Catenulispora yoronensis TaxID=450799 RepID=A0ABP5H6I4_9ACTN